MRTEVNIQRFRRGAGRFLHWVACRWFTPIEDRLHSSYEIDKRTLKRYLPNNPIIVEAGAHIGTDTMEMGAIWPRARIHAFEPVPDIFRQLSRRTTHASEITRYPFAIGKGRSWETIRVSSGASDASSSLLKPKQHMEEHPDVTFEREITVPTISLDQWSETYGIQQVNMLWLDLQGYELEALKGAETVLQSVAVVYSEVHLKEVYEGAPHYRDVSKWLASRGFGVVREFLPFPDSGNVLFVRM